MIPIDSEVFILRGEKDTLQKRVDTLERELRQHHQSSVRMVARLQSAVDRGSTLFTNILGLLCSGPIEPEFRAETAESIRIYLKSLPGDTNVTS